jgi:pimeloyl-ACP methyl ester carboxylesterase
MAHGLPTCPDVRHPDAQDHEQLSNLRRSVVAWQSTRRAFLGIVPIIAVVLGYEEVYMSQGKAVEGVKNVVLVHGGFVDGSGWQGVYDLLRKDGYNVAIVQNPTTSLVDDVAVTKRTLAAQNGPAILVGHSYGGVVITEAGNDAKVAGLVYIAAFAPDKGESVSALIKNAPPGAPVPPILPPQDGYLFLDRTQFRAAFAADVSADAAAFMADSQVPWGLEALNGAISEPAWKSKPSWYLVSTEDRMIPPDAQRAMSKRAGSTVAEVKGSHAVYVSQPQAVASIIAKAAQGVALATQ